jgi:TraM recognition site of TraD and TraG
VTSRDGRRDLGGGLVRLELVMGAAWREVLTPRITADGTNVAVRLVEAMRQGAIVMWRTYADDMPDEAAAITILALADLHAAAGLARTPWTLMLDEFGAVIHMAAARAVASLQRARSHHGQVIVITQSAADIEALSQQPGLLSSLSDNFTAFVAHRQTAPETRDWLAKLMGTRALWQSTDQTHSHGVHSGKGSRRRVREFRVGSDEFASLRRGEAVIYTTLGPNPRRTAILPARLPLGQPQAIASDVRDLCEIEVHPEGTVAPTRRCSAAVGELDLEDA